MRDEAGTGTGVPWLDDQQLRPSSAEEWRRHDTHVTEQGTYIVQQWSVKRCCIEKQLINLVKTELWYKQQVHQKMKYQIKINQQLLI
jgi:hypothetical protein